MKKLTILSTAMLVTVGLSSCADRKVINGVEYRPYGWLDKNEYKSDSIQYDLCAQNIILSVIFSETIVVPIVLTGIGLYEPVGVKEKVKVFQRPLSRVVVIESDTTVESDYPSPY